MENYIELFKEYHISDIGKNVLRGYFRYLTEESISKTPYHFIIQAENESTAINVAKIVCDIRSQIFNKSQKVAYFQEYDFLDKVAKEECDSAGIVVVYDCLKDSDYYLDDEDSSIVRDRKKDYVRMILKTNLESIYIYSLS